MSDQTRRNFLKYSGIAMAAVVVGAFRKSAMAADPVPLKPLAASDAQAKSLGFCSDAKKPTDQCKDRKAADKKEQFCKNCQLYTKSSGDGDKEVGKCLLFAKNVVPSGGWCKSWVKKPV